MKIALLQCNTVTGDVAGNLERIISTARQAGAAGADLCVTPELALCGVAPGHYLCAQGFENRTEFVVDLPQAAPSITPSGLRLVQ